MQQITEQREENQELVEYTEEQRSIERRRADLQEHQQNALIWSRTKWWITGISGGE